MPVTQRKRAFQLFRKLKFGQCASSTSNDEGQLEIDKMIMHVLDCLGALQCVMGQYDSSRAKIFWGAVMTIAEIGIDQSIGHVDKRHPGAVHLLRAFPNDQKASDGRGWLPLHWAAVTDNVDVKDIRNVARADPLATVKGYNQPISANPGHLIAAVRHPNMDVVRCLYNFYPRMASSKDNEGDLPLHYASRYSESIEMIQFLLQANPAATKVKGEGNLVPLQNALYNECDKKLDIVKCLLAVDSSAAKVITIDGDTCFHIALDQECNRVLLEELIKAFPEGLMISNDVGYLPLHAACFTKDTPRTKENVELLLQYNAEAARMTSDSGHLPAHIAAESSTPEVLQTVLAAYPQGISHVCAEDNDSTPLIKAVTSGNEGTVKYICQHYPDTVQVVNAHGLNPMHFAAEGENLEILRVLHETCLPNIEQPDKQGRLPLHVFLSVHPDITSKPSFEGECLRFFLHNYPHAIGTADQQGETPFSLIPRENIFLRRLLLRINPHLSYDEYKMLNYYHRRMAMFLAFCAINADGIPNIFCRLRSVDMYLLQMTLSYL